MKTTNVRYGARVFRFSQEETEKMKEDIRVHILHDDAERQSAWRLRLCLEGAAYCCATSKKEQTKRLRRLALYGHLTHDDLPCW